ncbi:MULTISPECIES: DUF6443 domain-containing protein [unclassified Flavobacterium]|uniref:DUF6443 domain-containing protein n=1 Tax=unclassified Flavobacterium TaxID=196869 RepID=UPI00096664EA|nr:MULTISPECIES: DUF6443 domain-containing protein [unclassified Flavobacterium]MBN9284875.1 RHS repeat-associated core domain-containing protein [Flavobacterium sp.]OJV71373.1 MAG: hypothetical protein BGO42_08125 [Flavobacterium sp. 40-81]
MKKLAILLLCAPLWVIAQTTTQNYTKKTVYREANGGRPASTVTYYDGLGRPVQQVANKQSATGKDIITHIEYDMGRQLKDYLPYAATTVDMSYQNNAQQATLNYSQYTGQYPFSEKLLEAAPSARPLRQGAPGADWQLAPNEGVDHSVKMEYQTNTGSEVKYYAAATTWDAAQGLYVPQLQNKGYYKASQLYKNISKNENWTSGKDNTVEVFNDKQGKLILKRLYNDEVAHDTYYVYDEYGNLTYVIPPLAANPETQLNDLCYQYKYDSRNRMAEKKLPGKQWEFMVYDKLDRVVASGPVLTPFGGTQTGWIVSKYDGLGRVVYTGWLATSDTRSALQSQRNAANTNFSEKRATATTVDGISIGYTNVAFPTSGMKLLSVLYYDDYAYPNAPTVPSQVEGQNITTAVKGLATGGWTRVQTNASETFSEQGYTFYDLKSRPVRTYTTNYLGGYTQTDTKLDFMGKTLYTKTYHKHSSSATLLTLTDSFTYTEQDRLLLHKHQINGGAEQLLAKNTYDELGKLISKNVGGLDPTGAFAYQKVDYRYNIRGWLTDINNTAATDSPRLQMEETDLFGFKINYNEVTESQNGNVTKTTSSMSGKVKPLYNGNIAETFWKTKSDYILRKYGYQYDNLNRLNTAFYQKPETQNPTPGSYNETVSYDKNGNITALQRTGNLDNPVFAIDIDNLSYFYNGNKLMRVNDATNNPEGFTDNGYGNTYDDYAYDANGNMIKDENKKITNIVYNHLNLPVEITFSGGNKINYLYNAAGVKVQKKVTEGAAVKTTDYLGGFQYVNSKLVFFTHAEGYVKVTDDVYFNYVFHFTDHLGNFRASWTLNEKTGELQIMEENHYYPFGLKHKAYNTEQYTYTMPMDGTPGYNVPELAQEESRNPNPYKYKHNGKELQEELGLNLYDYGARNYDAAIGRWMNIDPLAEQSRRWTPYNYAYNNPMFFVDPDGMQAVSTSNIYDDRIQMTTAVNNEKNEEREDGVIYKSGHWSDTVREDNNNNNNNNNDEPPVNLFKPTAKQSNQKVFNDVFNEMNKKENYEDGDGIFSVYGHGGLGHIGNLKGDKGKMIFTAEDFDKMMSERSVAYRNQLEKNQPFTLFLYSCESATEYQKTDQSIARKISAAHPKATILGFDGYVIYGTRNGKATIVGSSSDLKRNNNQGYIVTYQNGQEINRILYSEYKKQKK